METKNLLNDSGEFKHYSDLRNALAGPLRGQRHTFIASNLKRRHDFSGLQRFITSSLLLPHLRGYRGSPTCRIALQFKRNGGECDCAAPHAVGL